MAKYAIIKGTDVENITEWDGDASKWSPPTGTTAVLYDPSTDPVGVGWTYKDSKFTAPVITLTDTENWKNLRDYRNQLLQETDWWGASDLPTMTDARKDYRQSLRNLPANTSDPSKPTWPTKPN